jgi:hypothetical protein
MKAILVFVTTAYALSIGLSLIVGLTGGHDNALIGLATSPCPAGSCGAGRKLNAECRSAGTMGLLSAERTG